MVIKSKHRSENTPISGSCWWIECYLIYFVAVQAMQQILKDMWSISI